MVSHQRSSPVGRWEGSWLAGPALWAPPTLFWLPAPHLRPILDLLEGLLCEGHSWVLAQGQQSWLTRMKGFGVRPSKALGKLSFFPCSGGSVTPRHSLRRPKRARVFLGPPCSQCRPRDTCPRTGHQERGAVAAGPKGAWGQGSTSRFVLCLSVSVSILPLTASFLSPRKGGQPRPPLCTWPAAGVPATRVSQRSRSRVPAHGRVLRSSAY